MLIGGLPQTGPHTKGETNGIEYGFLNAQLWALQWTLTESNVIAAKAAGSKKVKMPADQMPRFPWDKPDNGDHELTGSLGDHTQEEVLDLLDNL